MTSSRTGELAARHRLFHAMVLMGGSLALRCGGETNTNNAGSGAGGAATGGVSSATGGDATGGTVSGGSISLSGGSFGGGLIVPATGGQPSPPPDCPPTQWNCAGNFPTCYGSGFQLPEGCKCELDRPLSAADCGADQSLVCLEATFTLSGQQLPESVPFQCACAPKQPNCEIACDAIFANSGNCTQIEHADTGLREVLCRCAIIVLR